MVVLKCFAEALLCRAEALLLSRLARQGGKDWHWPPRHRVPGPNGPEAARDFPWNSGSCAFGKLGSSVKGHASLLSVARCTFVLWGLNFSPNCNPEGFSFGVVSFLPAHLLLDFS